MSATNSNQFSPVLNDVEQSPQSQRTERLISGIAQILKSTSNQMTGQQWGNELQQLQSQLVKACQQGG